MAQIIEIDCELDPDLIELLELSGKLRTREELMRQIVLDAVDPVIAVGSEFIFEQREDRDDYISLEIPDRNAQVDLAIAWTVAQLDARACALVLETDHSLAATIRVYRNTLDWLAFWSVRHPNDNWRAEFRAQLSVRRAVLQKLKDRAGFRFEFEMLEELKAIA